MLGACLLHDIGRDIRASDAFLFYVRLFCRLPMGLRDANIASFMPPYVRMVITCIPTDDPGRNKRWNRLQYCHGHGHSRKWGQSSQFEHLRQTAPAGSEY